MNTRRIREVSNEPGEARGRAGVSGTRFGRTAIVKADGTPMAMRPGQVVPGTLGLVHLVDGDVSKDPQLSQEMANEAPGSWVLTLKTIVTKPVATPNYGATRLIAPTVARISFNSGGVARELWVDANDATVVLPSTYVTVDVGYSQTIGDADGAAGPYLECEVQGAIHRGNGQTKATRSIYVFEPSTEYLRVPAFAEAFCYLPFGLVTGAVAVAGSVGLANLWAGLPAGGGQMLEFVPQEIFSTNARGHCFRKIHPGAERFYLALVETVPGTVDYPGTLIFQLGL
jgi:hypothetical protein